MSGRIDGRIEVGHGLSIGQDEIELRFVRASGPGGQNVNKVSTAVELRFDLARTPSLPDPVKSRVARAAGRRLTLDGVIVLNAEEYRTQEMNRAAAVERLTALIAGAVPAPRRRRPTRPTKASIERRHAAKGKRAAIKGARSRPPVE